MSIDTKETTPITDDLLHKIGYKQINKHKFIHNDVDCFIDIYKDRDGYFPYNFHEDVIIGRKIEGLQHLKNIIFDLTGKIIEEL